MQKTIPKINAKIKSGDVSVVTAQQMIEIVREKGAKKAADEIDVVTTATMGAMCSSGVFLNFGQSEIPTKLQKVWLNGVEAHGGLAAVDIYLGATQQSDNDPEYGGGDVIEDLVSGKEIGLKARSVGTHCYPGKKIKTRVTINDLNQAILMNPRNAYQNYNAAANSSNRRLYTYMGILSPRLGNVTYSSAGQLSPLLNDPHLLTIGTGTRIFLGGGTGYVICSGTQHNTEVAEVNGVPSGPARTLMVSGDLKSMNGEFLRAAHFKGYGTSLYVGIGVPIPILSEDIAKFTAVSNSEIFTNIVDYSVERRERPVLKSVSYDKLRSGDIDIDGKKVKTSSLSSYAKALKIANLLKKMIENNEFELTEKLMTLPQSSFKPMREIHREILVKDIMRSATACDIDSDIYDVASALIENSINHIPILKNGEMVGIVTSWDIAKSVASGKNKLEDIMTKMVVTVNYDQTVESAAKKMADHHISALPVIKDKKVVGVISSEGMSKLLS